MVLCMEHLRLIMDVPGAALWPLHVRASLSGSWFIKGALCAGVCTNGFINLNHFVHTPFHSFLGPYIFSKDFITASTRDNVVHRITGSEITPNMSSLHQITKPTATLIVEKAA